MREQLISLTLFAMVMTFSPGPANVLLASSGVRYGLRRSIPLWLGIVMGLVVLLAVTALGLGSLLHAEPSIQIVMKAIGSVYLVWLGWNIAHSESPNLAGAEQPGRPGYLVGFTNTLVNPKGWTMAVGAAAGYASLSPSALGLALILGAVFAMVAVPNWLLWCGGEQAISRALRTDRAWRIANGILGALVLVSVAPMWLE